MLHCKPVVCEKMKPRKRRDTKEPFIDKIKDGVEKGVDKTKDMAQDVKGGVLSGVDVLKEIPQFVDRIFSIVLEEMKKQANTLPKKAYETVILPLWNKIKWLMGWIRYILSILCLCSIFSVLYSMGIPQLVMKLIQQLVRAAASPPGGRGKVAFAPGLFGSPSKDDGNGDNNNSNDGDSDGDNGGSMEGSLGIFDVPANFANNLKESSSQKP